MHWCTQQTKREKRKGGKGERTWKREGKTGKGETGKGKTRKGKTGKGKRKRKVSALWFRAKSSRHIYMFSPL